MNRIALIIILITVFGSVAHGQLNLDLVEVIEQAKKQSPAAKAAETRKKNQYWEYRRYRAGYNPFLNLSGSLPGYNRSYNQVIQPDGTYAFRNQEQFLSNMNLGLVQPISFSGGEISVNTNMQQFYNLNPTGNESNPIYNATLFNIQLDQPIFGFNQLKWDKRTEPLRYEESKRSYVEEMEAVSAEATRRYFDYLDAQINLQIAEFNLANNDTIFRIEEGRYNIGTTGRDKLLQVELQLLRSKQEVVQAKLDLQTNRLALRRYIGLQDSSANNIELVLPDELPNFEIPLLTALEYAKQNRSDYLEFERRRMEAEREVERARLQRNQTNLSASFGLNNSAGSIPNTYENPNNQQRVNVTLSVPIVDWGRSKARIQTAVANQELIDYTLTQEIQLFEQEIITLVSRFEVLRSQIEITKKSDAIAQERYDVSQNQYLIGKIDITNLNIALSEKDDARRNYIGALRSFWTSYFELRRLTLYDFANDELLYQEAD